jgi:hypothetical protein
MTDLEQKVIDAARVVLATWDEPVRTPRSGPTAENAAASFETIRVSVDALRVALAALSAPPAPPTPTPTRDEIDKALHALTDAHRAAEALGCSPDCSGEDHDAIEAQRRKP